MILTSRERGLASLVIPELVRADRLHLVGVIKAGSRPRGPMRRGRRILRKVRRIGILGACNGLRMRHWYRRDVSDRLQLLRIEEVCRECQVALDRTPHVGSALTESALRDLEPDIALSLGNGLIPDRVFTVPHLGMLNVHHELLPEFRGAQSVLWQLFEGSARTGFSIHRIDSTIDTGAVIHREEMAIVFGRNLGETVTDTVCRLYEASARSLVRILPDVDELVEAAGPQGPGRSFTTPSFRQFRTMVRNHDRLAAEALARGPLSAGRTP